MSTSYINMNVRSILDFYARNALYDSKHEYLEKFSNLSFFFLIFLLFALSMFMIIVTIVARQG